MYRIGMHEGEEYSASEITSYLEKHEEVKWVKNNIDSVDRANDEGVIIEFVLKKKESNSWKFLMEKNKITQELDNYENSLFHDISGMWSSEVEGRENCLYGSI